MKFLKKATLAAAVAVAPFAAQAELKAMDDAMMSATTGQAGVTIEIDMDASGITVGEVAYTDQGTLVLENIQVSETDITQTIDVLTDGSLQIGMETSNNLTIDIGNGVEAGSSAVALRSTAGEQTEVVNDVHLVVDLQSNDTTIVNMAAAGAAANYNITQTFDNGAGVTSSAAAGSAVILADMDVRIVDLDVGAFGYTQAQADVRGSASAANYATGYAALSDQNGNGLADEQAAYTAANAFDADNDGAIAGSELTALQGAIAGGSAVKLNNITFDNGSGGAVNVQQTIWADSNGVYIAMGDIDGTLNVGGIEIGGASIGSVAVSDIQLGGLTQRIYGHN